MLIFGRVKYGPDHWTLGLLDYFLDLSIDYQWGRGGGGWEIVLVLLINGVLTGSHKQFSRLNFLCQGFCAELLRFFNFVFFFFIDPISGLRRQEGSRNFWSLAHN